MKPILFTLTLMLAFCFSVDAQQLTYKPVNSAFGGNYLNYSWLMQSANAQNPFDDQDEFGLNNSVVGSFSDTIKRQILSQLTRNILNGEEGGIGSEPGTFEIGGLIIEVQETRTGSVITIIDTETGESTEIIL